MEMTMEQGSVSGVSKGRVWSGRILTALVVAFLVFDGVTKIMKEQHVMAAAVQLGFPGYTMPIIGCILLVCTLIYVIPRTAFLGSVLLTGYLGGAVVVQLRVANPAFETVFPIFFGILVWAGLCLRESRIAKFVFKRS
ncbi:MAG TPA: DoxX family protein [Candidatus Acidoferrales bacterium]